MGKTAVMVKGKSVKMLPFFLFIKIAATDLDEKKLISLSFWQSHSTVTHTKEDMHKIMR